MQVPYTPYPTVSPYADLPRPIHIETPPAAFGVNIGQAIEGVGKQVEQGGNELFQRAVALQELRNETEAKEADAQYMIDAGQRHAQFSSLEGKGAVDGFPQYVKDLQEMRQKYRANLSNDQARRMFDSSSLSVMSRTVFNGAGYTATQNKAWVNGVANANGKAANNLVLQNPEDEGVFQDALSKAYDKVATEAQLHSHTPQEFQQNLKDEFSGVRLQRIEGLARIRPDAAKKMLNEHIGELNGADKLTAQRITDEYLNRIWSRNIAQQVHNGQSLEFGAGIVDMDRAKDAISRRESGGDYNNVTPSYDKHGRYQEAMGKYQIMNFELKDDLAKAGYGPMTKEEFLANHAAQEKVFEVKFGGYMQKYGSFNAAAQAWFAGEGSLGKPDAMNRADFNGKGTPVWKYLADTNKYLSQTATFGEKETMVRKMSEQMSDDPRLPDIATKHLETYQNEDIRAKRDEDFKNKNIIDNSLLQMAQGKMKPSLDSMLVSPEAHAAWDKLDPKDQLAMYGKISQMARGHVPDTPERTTLFHQLKGMAEEKPVDFVGQDIMGMDLTLQQKNTLLDLQQKKHAVPDQDPHVQRAMTWLAPTLESLHLTHAQDEKGRMRFVGALQDELVAWQQEKLKPPNEEETRSIGNRLLQTMVESPGRFFGTNTVPMYRTEVPAKAKEIILRDPKWGGIKPDDETVRREYIRTMWKDLYGNK